MIFSIDYRGLNFPRSRGGPWTGPPAVVGSGAAGFSGVRLRPYCLWECPVHHGQAGFFRLVVRWRSASWWPGTGVLGACGYRAGFPLSLHLAQVHGQVVGEPAVAGPEGLGLGGLGVAHDAEPIVVGVERHDAVIADPELLPGAGVVQVLGSEAQQPGVGMDGLFPFNGAAPGVLPTSMDLCEIRFSGRLNFAHFWCIGTSACRHFEGWGFPGFFPYWMIWWCPSSPC